ncbi:MAG TPA: PAS domain-containing sensor histidine kinase [Bryobacteraceae bacterium]|nr:PAS domain-containing sensor histidine kinase [Bryobacteraceae bacterium]
MPTRLSVLGVRIPENAIQRKRVVPVALSVLGSLTALEWYSRFDFSLGIFYTVPVVIAATALNRKQIVGFGVLCAATRGLFTPAASDLEFFLKFLMASTAYCASGLLVVEMSNNRRRVIEHYARLKMEEELRHRAEEQLRILADSSPAAVLTLDAESRVQAANRAAHDMLGFAPGTMLGQKVDANFPIFADALKVSMKDCSVRTSVTGWAKRCDEQMFPIQTWFSAYGPSDARYLAAIVVDMSEEVRERERENFQHLLDYNRLLAGAVSHEIRNLCSAISVVCSNLSQRSDLRNDADFDALTRLVDGLSRLASFKLRHKAENETPRVDIRSVLDQLRVVIEPDWEEVDGRVVWSIPESAPDIGADSHGLLQIFLNLCQNSLRAVENMPERELNISVELNSDDAIVTVADSGPGVGNLDMLFHPFRPGADGSGLGLYISRELARSFGGDLHHVPTDKGCAFRVTLPYAVSGAREQTGVAGYFTAAN